MIAHRAVRMNLPGRLCAGFAQRAQKAIAVGVLQKNRFPPIAPAHHVIKRASYSIRRGRGIPLTLPNR
jgi:hypothetical protein